LAHIEHPRLESLSDSLSEPEIWQGIRILPIKLSGAVVREEMK